jgi:hypothetical protein
MGNGASRTAQSYRAHPRLYMDFAITCSLVQPGRRLYPVHLHQAAALLNASIRPRLAATPLRIEARVIAPGLSCR